MAFSTAAVNDAFKTAFTVPATVILSAPVELGSAKELHLTMGKLCADGHRAVQSLKRVDKHVPAAGSILKEDVYGAVEATFDGLWIVHKPKIGEEVRRRRIRRAWAALPLTSPLRPTVPPPLRSRAFPLCRSCRSRRRARRAAARG